MSNHNTRERIDAIANAATPEQQTELIRQFHSDYLPKYQRWARSMVARHRLPHDLTGDAINEVYLAVDTIIRSRMHSNDIDNWDGILYAACIGHFRSIIHKSKFRGSAPSSVSRNRRSTYLRTLQDDLTAQWGRTVTDAETVAYFNEVEAPRRFTQPKRSVGTASISDLTSERTVPLDGPDGDNHEPRHITDTSGDYVISRHEGRVLIERIIAAAADHSPRLGRTARTWLGGYLNPDNEPEPLTATEVAQHLNVSYETARRHIREIRTLALDIVTTDNADELAAAFETQPRHHNR